METTLHADGVIDPDILIDAMHGIPNAITFLDEQQEVGIQVSIISAMELVADIDTLVHAIRNVVAAQGGIEKLAIQTNGNFQDIYDALNSNNPPQLNRLLDILSFYTGTTPIGL